MRVKGDYVLMLLQCIVGVFAIALLRFLKRKVRLDIPSVMLVMYAVFLFCAIFLGEVRSFYYHVPYWDTLLHTFSGAALGALGFSIISLLNDSRSSLVSLSPAFVALFAFCFAVTLGAIWEIYEFAADYLFGTNMQKYALETGEALVGQAALFDTMKDVIVDTIGAGTISLIGYLSLKYQKDWLDHFRIKREKVS